MGKSKVSENANYGRELAFTEHCSGSENRKIFESQSIEVLKAV